MTYNFDPDRWYENQCGLLDAKLARGEMSAQQHREALRALDQRYEQMLERLDGTYRIPDAGDLNS